MSLMKRLAGNTVAAGMGVVFSAATQLITVPILAWAWGVERYGVWLMLTTIPSYLSLSDFGFATAATVQMTVSCARGDRADVVRTFHAVLCLQYIISAILIFLALLVFFLGRSAALFPHWAIENTTVIATLILYSIGILFCRTILAPLRACGHYAFGTFLHDALAFSEGIVVLVLAAAGNGILPCAVALLVVRLIMIAVLEIARQRRLPWLPSGIRFARWTKMRVLLKPALAALAIPTTLAVNIQGMILIAGYFISPAVVPTLSATRTLSRTWIQLIAVANRASMPEFSAAYARGDVSVRDKILRIHLLLVLLVLLPGSALFAFFGSRFVGMWTAGHIVPESGFIALMALATFIHGLWYFASNLLLSTNNHARLAGVLWLSCIGAFLVAVTSATSWGLIGIAVAIIAGEFIALTGAYLGRGGIRFSRKDLAG